MHNLKQKIVMYKNGEIELEVSLKNQTLWLTQQEISILFEKDRTVITRHINNILEIKEVNKQSNVQKMHIANSNKPVTIYSLDVILAVGYRTNSAKAILFRQWATKILKEYLYSRYVINGNKITHQRFKELEYEVASLRRRLSIVENSKTQPTQGIFFQGQLLESAVFITKLIQNAKKEIILIDNYINAITIDLLKNAKVPIKIYTKEIPKIQGIPKNIQIHKFTKSHDRFLVIDDEGYLIGASLKDAGRSCFAFSKLEKQNMQSLLDNLLS